MAMLTINLLNWRKRQRLMIYLKISSYWFVAVIGAGILLLYIHHALLQHQQNQQRYLKALQQQNQSKIDVQQSIVAIHDANNFMEKQLHLMHQREIHLQNRITLFKKIPFLLPKGIVLKKIELKNNRLTMEGLAANYSVLLTWVKNLNSQQLVHQSKLLRGNQSTSHSELAFKVRIIIKEKEQRIVSSD